MLETPKSPVFLLSSPPRAVRMRVPAILRATAPAILFALGALALLGFLHSDFRVRSLLAARGVETSGTVGGPVWGRSTGRSSHPEIQGYWYDYEVGGRSFNASSPRATRYSIPTRGSRIPVTYSPDDPAVALPYAKRSIPAGFFGGFGELPLYFWYASLFALVAALVAMPRIWRERRLARYGEEAAATVLGQSGSAARPERVFGMAVENPGGRRSGGFRTEYQFRTRDGRDVRGELRKDPERREPGLSLRVLYDPARPERHGPLLSLEYWRF